MNSLIRPTLQDFSLLSTYVRSISDEKKFQDSISFYFFALDLILDLQQDEIEDSITDSHYLNSTGKSNGHDRGIDAIYIDEFENPPVVHLFNFKYSDDFKKINKNFPSQEIDKIVGFVSALIRGEEDLVSTINPTLAEKVSEIWEIYKKQNPKFKIHICSNFSDSFEAAEKQRFEKEVSKFSNFQFNYYSLLDFVNLLTKGDKKEINGRIKIIDQNLFEKSDGDVRALVGDVDVRDLLRLVVNDEEMRQNVDLENYSELVDFEISSDVFDDNVRNYLKQRSKINRNIKETALSEEDNFRFFYFNNGITLTCTNFSYPKNRRSPIVELKNIQVVNGCQTINALFEAFKENPNVFKNVDVLCRIYETQKEQLSIDIAEYTNSQNPVTSRDIRSNDFIQKKLSKELEAKGYYYERKKRQYTDQQKLKRIDAEKVGQDLMAFFNFMPGEAKDRKKLIFGDKYEDVFSDNITGDDVLLVFTLFGRIEDKKALKKIEIMQNDLKFEQESFVLHASYYILYALSKICEIKKVEKNLKNIEKIFGFYDQVVEAIKKSVDAEKKALTGFRDKYNHRNFFKGNKLKDYLEEYLDPDTEKQIRIKGL